MHFKGLIYKKTIFVNVFVSNITFNFGENRLVKFFNYLSDVIPASFPVQIPRCRFLLNVPIENVSDKRAIVLQDIIMIGFDLTSHWLRNAKSKTKSDDPHFRFDWALPFQTLTETSCQLERQMAKTMDDAFVPECKTDGDYADVQCFEHEGFAKQCWCVTKDGQEIKDTRTSDGLKPDCSAAVVAKEVKKLEKQHDKPTEHKDVKPAENETTFEVDVQVELNDTQIGNVCQRYSFLFVITVKRINYS